MKNFKISCSFTLLSILFLVSACGDDPKFTFPAKVFTIDKAYDVGNNNDASDIRVNVSLEGSVNASDIQEVRLIVVKTGKTISTTDLPNLAPGNFFSAQSEDGVNVIKPTSSIKDSDGNSIVNGESYNVYVAAIGRDDAVSLSKSKFLLLKNKPIYAGDYVGIWRDQKISNLKISITIADDYTGSIYYTDKFAACCAGQQDGLLVMKVNGNIIESFDYDQYLGNYPAGTGGHCPTKVSATGQFKDDIELSLDPFPFSDCDGAGRTVTISELIRQ